MSVREISSSYDGQGYPSQSYGGNDTTHDSASLRQGRTSAPTPFRVYTDESGTKKKKKISSGIVYCGNEEISVSEIELPTDGTVYLLVTCSSGSYSGELVTTQPTAADNKVFRKLYDVSGGKVTYDYRLAPVFVVYN